MAIALVDQGKNWRPTSFTHVKQLSRTFFDALSIIEQHDGAVRRHERSVCVFRKIFVTRRV